MFTREDERWKSRLAYFEKNKTWNLADFLQWGIVFIESFGKKEEEHRTYRICLEKLFESPHLLNSCDSESVQQLASQCLGSLEVKTFNFCFFVLFISLVSDP